MSKRKRSQPVTPAPVSRNDLTLKLEPDAKLSVTVLTPEKPNKPLSRSLRVLFVTSFLLAVAWGLLFWYYVYPTVETPQPIEFRDAGLAVAVTYPAYATYKDELELLLHITNRGAEAFTGNVSCVFQGGVPAYPLPAESATAKLEKLAAGAGSAHRLKFALRQAPRWSRGATVATQLRVTTDKGSFPPQAGPVIAVVPHPVPLRTINTWLGNSIVLGVIAALLWEVVRKRFFGWEAK